MDDLELELDSIKKKLDQIELELNMNLEAIESIEMSIRFLEAELNFELDGPTNTI